MVVVKEVRVDLMARRNSLGQAVYPPLVLVQPGAAPRFKGKLHGSARNFPSLPLTIFMGGGGRGGAGRRNSDKVGGWLT